MSGCPLEAPQEVIKKIYSYLGTLAVYDFYAQQCLSSWRSYSFLRSSKAEQQLLIGKLILVKDTVTQKPTAVVVHSFDEDGHFSGPSFPLSKNTENVYTSKSFDVCGYNLCGMYFAEYCRQATDLSLSLEHFCKIALYDFENLTDPHEKGLTNSSTLDTDGSDLLPQRGFRDPSTAYPQPGTYKVGDLPPFWAYVNGQRVCNPLAVKEKRFQGYVTHRRHVHPVWRTRDSDCSFYAVVSDFKLHSSRDRGEGVFFKITHKQSRTLLVPYFSKLPAATHRPFNNSISERDFSERFAHIREEFYVEGRKRSVNLVTTDWDNDLKVFKRRLFDRYGAEVDREELVCIPLVGQEDVRACKDFEDFLCTTRRRTNTIVVISSRTPDDLRSVEYCFHGTSVSSTYSNGKLKDWTLFVLSKLIELEKLGGEYLIDVCRKNREAHRVEGFSVHFHYRTPFISLVKQESTCKSVPGTAGTLHCYGPDHFRTLLDAFKVASWQDSDFFAKQLLFESYESHLLSDMCFLHAHVHGQRGACRCTQGNGYDNCYWSA